jgi:hypothetical protein
MVRTQDVLNRKHLGLRALWDTAGITLRLLARGQTNFVRMLWKFSSILNADRLCADHHRAVRYALRPPDGARPRAPRPLREQLYVHHPTLVETAGVS